MTQILVMIHFHDFFGLDVSVVVLHFIPQKCRISLNNVPIWKIQNLAYSGLQLWSGGHHNDLAMMSHTQKDVTEDVISDFTKLKCEPGRDF